MCLVRTAEELGMWKWNDFEERGAKTQLELNKDTRLFLKSPVALNIRIISSDCFLHSDPPK